MATNFPTSLDNGTSLPYPSSSNLTNSPSLASGQDNQNDSLIAIQNKLGITASTPTASNLLIGTSAGTSTWSKLAPTGVIVGTTDSQTLTNKTLTSPTITGAILTNANITTDLITGFTTSNSGTVFGVPVTTGVIQSANTINGSAIIASSIGTSAIAAGGITGAKITTNAFNNTGSYTTGSIPFGTTSTTFVSITGISTPTVNMPVNNGTFIVSGVMYIQLGSATSADLDYRIVMDGVTVANTPTAGFQRVTLLNQNMAVSGALNVVFSNVASGNHTFALQIKTSGGAVNVNQTYSSFTVMQYFN